MSHIAYVNGRYVPHRDGAVHIEDRGFQFADGVYEVIAVHRGRLVDMGGHMERLERSLAEVRIAWPVARNALGFILAEVIRRNRVKSGMVYLQMTRGVAPRNFPFPKDTDGSLIVTSRSTPAFNLTANLKGVDVVSMPDIRWKRPDIKSISLLPNVLSKQRAVEAGAFEGWMLDAKGRVTEGTSSNAWIVTKMGELVTRPTADNGILSGITRKSIMKVAKEEGLRLIERAFTLEEAIGAQEAFLTSTTSFVKPVVRIDGKPIGNGKVGKVAERLLTLYGEYMDRPLH